MTLAAERWGFAILRAGHVWLRVLNLDKDVASSRFLVAVFQELEEQASSEVSLLRRLAGRAQYMPQVCSFLDTLQLLAPVSVDLLPFAEARLRIVQVGAWENRCPVKALPGVRCILEAGHDGLHRYRCASRFCPGWPMHGDNEFDPRVSSLPHPTPPCF